jgi:hypothetical protein
LRPTFVDSSVLLAAARGEDEAYQRAMDVLDDPERDVHAHPAALYVRGELGQIVLTYGHMQLHDTQIENNQTGNLEVEMQFVTVIFTVRGVRDTYPIRSYSIASG